MAMNSVSDSSELGSSLGSSDADAGERSPVFKDEKSLGDVDADDTRLQKLWHQLRQAH
jgi:hypothetical protein